MDESTRKHGVMMRKLIKEKIIEYLEIHGYAPSVREIGDMVALKSTSSVHTHILRMIDEGELETDAKPGSPRAIRVPGYKVTKEKYIPIEGMYHTGRQIYVKEGDEPKQMRAGFIRPEAMK